jgi:hypothetical protein
MKLFCAILLCLLPLCAQVKFTPSDDRVAVEIDGKPFTTFYFAGKAPKPYLHPLTTAAGLRITRNYPMEMTEGETRDHPHHRGLWFTHGDVNKVDFWINEEPRRPHYGIITKGKVLEAKGGKQKGVIKASCEWQSPASEPLLTETRGMTFYSAKDVRTIDFDVTFTALAGKVVFGDTKEGFFAIRLRDEFTERKKGAVLQNAEGKRTMREVWGKASPWVDYSGTLEGQKLGVAIFDHPGNPKHPTFWHARDYGLFAANALGEHDFFNDKTRNGSLTIEKGKSLRFRYRVLIHPGETADANLPAKFAEYAKTK